MFDVQETVMVMSMVLVMVTYILIYVVLYVLFERAVNKCGVQSEVHIRLVSRV